MASLDATFLIDLLNGVPEAVERARELDESGEPLEVAPPAAAEVLVGAHFAGGPYLEKARELIAGLDLLEFDDRACQEAGQVGADLMGRGLVMAWMDLLIAAVTKRHSRRLITKDPVFARVRGLVVEFY
ncbi:MAG: PIN domain-containing protein [Thermoplasmata archaeon]